MGKKILLLEDNVLNCELVTDILEMEGYTVTAAGNGTDGLALLESETFDLILTDINLPKTDGIEFLTRARKISGEHCIILAMTSNSTTRDGKSFEEVGFDGFIPKPFKVTDFRKYIHSLLGETQ